MKRSNPLKILILTLFILLGNGSYGQQCASLFESKEPQAIEFQNGESLISHIQDPRWLERKLLGEGELSKIRKSSYRHTHVEFYSEMLYESIKILLADFYGGDPLLEKIPNSEGYLKAIVQNINNHIENRNVTREYFIKINWIMANLITLKNVQNLTGQEFLAKLAAAKTKEHLQKLIETEAALFDLYLPVYLRSESVVIIPTFADLTVENMIELGIISAKFFPAGMTTKKHPKFDGVKKACARDFFFHDITHAGDIMYERLRDDRHSEQEFFSKSLESLEIFYLKHRKLMSLKDRFFTDRIVFSFVHENELDSLYNFLHFKRSFDEVWSAMNSIHKRASGRSEKQVVLDFMRRETNFIGTDAELESRVKESFRRLIEDFKISEQKLTEKSAVRKFLERIGL